MKQVRCNVLSGGCLFGALVFLGTTIVAEAGETAMKGRYVNLKAETNCTEVGDVDGHVICSFVLPSAGIQDDGEVYSRVVRGTLDYIKGVGKNQGHTINTFADGSVTTVEWEGTSKFDENKTRVMIGTYRCTGGTGRFQGVECEGNWTSTQQKGGFSVGEYEGTMTLPD